ncbi:MAG: hypothetical protein F7B60_02440 [Desulfurococcales archaeon]|nr:hypothetical protein [Desulfurococcales archaeon]
MNTASIIIGTFHNALSFDAGAAGDHEGMMGGCCGGWGWMGVGVLFWFLAIIVVVAVVVYLVDRISRMHRSDDRLEDEIYRLRREIRELREKKDS